MSNAIMPATTTNNNATDSASASVQGIIEVVYTSTAQWVGQCTGTSIDGGTVSKSDNNSSGGGGGGTFHRRRPQQQQQQQQHEEKDDDGIYVVEHHQSNDGDDEKGDTSVPSSTPLAKATDSYDEDGEEEKKTDETNEAPDESHPSSSSSLSSSSEQFTKVIQDALEGCSLAVCLNPFWTTTGCDQHDRKALAHHAFTETQRSNQRKKNNKKKKKSHKKRKDNHKPRGHQQICSDGDVVGEPNTERKHPRKKYDLDRSDDAVVVANEHGPTSPPPSETVVESKSASFDVDGDHNNEEEDEDDIDDDEMDDTIDSLATRESVGTLQTNYTDVVGGNNTVMSSSVRSDTRSIHSFLMVNEPHRPSTAFSMTTSNKPPQSYSLSHRYAKARNSPFTPSKHSSFLESKTSPLSPSTALSQSIAETDEEDRSPSDNVLTPSLMQQIKHHLPFGRRDDSFWLQYSMVRDGASIGQLLRRVVDCNCRYSVLAVETMDGEIFGSYLSHSWEQPQPKHWYGGGESFLWTTAYHDAGESAVIEAGHTASSIYSKPPSIREINVGSVRNRPSSSRRRSSSSIHRGSSAHSDQKVNNEKDSTQLHVYHYTFANSYIQLCEHDRLIMGGGFSSGDGSQNEGFGLALDGDLLMGSSAKSPTFGNPSLSYVHRDGSPFEIRNIEVWSLHPCLSLVESDGRKVIHRSRSSRPKTKQPKSSSSSSKRQLPSKKKYQGPMVGTLSMSEDLESSDKRLGPNGGSKMENDNNGFDPYGRKGDGSNDQLVSATW